MKHVTGVIFHAFFLYHNFDIYDGDTKGKRRKSMIVNKCEEGERRKEEGREKEKVTKY